MIRHSWVIFLNAVLLTTESIAIEIMTTQLDLAPLVVASSSSLFAGSLLLLIATFKDRERTLSVFRLWKLLIPASVLVAGGLFAFIDSVSSVGASKVGLLAGPLEMVVIIFLAWAILREKLSAVQKIGVMIALGGFFATIMSDISGATQEEPFRLGDAEAVISAVMLGVGIVLVTRLTKAHSAVAVSGSLLLISGVILAALLWASTTPDVTLSELSVLFLFSLLPLSVTLTYVAGLARVGASLTSVISSFSILLTPLFQLALLGLNVQAILPSNIPLALAGGGLGVLGIYLIHRNNRRH
ncbi:MAG: EamA family transporter [Nitrososphaera sp.]